MANSNSKPEHRSSQEKSEALSKKTPETEANASSQAGEYQAPPYNDLPFLHFPKDYNSTRYWQVPHSDDYFDACHRGYEYAFQFIKFLRDYPDETVESGLLSSIAADIDFNENGDRKGYWVGIFDYLEKVLYEQAKIMDFKQEWQRLQDQFEALRKSDG